MFIDHEDTVTVKVYYRKVGHSYSALGATEFSKAKMLTEAERKEYECLTLKMKVMDWGTYNDLQDGAMIYDASGDRRFSYKLYKESRLPRLIVDWDAKGKDGKPVPVEISMIRTLSPNIAEAILTEYDSSQFVSEDEEKKS